ncbi:MAG: peroxiredoxin [Acidobacteriota bacterium]|jgi:peroxiredoxin Q/BCP|nr:peroxiredoxin [Acidobacteriota bacterium]
MKIGDKAPDFTLKDGDGNDWSLSENLGKVIVLLFYPGDNTPVCTKQLCSVRDNWEEYANTGAEIIGISTDSVESHKDFAKKHNFPFTLLADENGEVVGKYDVKSWIPNKSARAVTVIDKDGIVRKHKVQSLSVFKPSDEEVLAAIAEVGE